MRWHNRLMSVASIMAGVVIASTARATEPLLVRDLTRFGANPTPSVPLQLVALPPFASATNIDGSLAKSPMWALSTHANPWQDGLLRVGAEGFICLKDGAFSPTEIDLSFPTKGPAIPVGRTFDFSGSGASSNAQPQGVNWHQSAWPELVRDGTDLYIVFGGDRFLGFRNTNLADPTDTFRGVNGAAGAVVVRTVDENGFQGDIYTYHDGAGNRVEFFGSGFAANGVPLNGRMWRVVDAAGKTAHVGNSASASGNVADAIGTGFDTSGRVVAMLDGGGRRFLFSYSGPRLSMVTVEAGTLVLGVVEYSYYGNNDPNGSEGDLKQVAVRTRMSPTGTAADSGPELVRKQYYRYWKGTHSTENPGHQHLVRLFIDSEGYRRFGVEPRTGTNPLNTDINLVSDADLRQFAAVALEYDAMRRVSKSALPTDDSDTSDSVTNDTIASYFYEENSSFSGVATPEYDQAWKFRTLVKHSSTRWATYYFDETGQSLGSVATDGAPAAVGGHTVPTSMRSWNTDVHRDAAGQIDRIATPASVPLGLLTPLSASPSRDGQVIVLERIGTGVMQGFVRAVRHQQGALNGSGNPFDQILLSSVRYVGESGNPDFVKVAVGTSLYEIVRPLVASTRRYDGETTSIATGPSQDSPETTFTYESLSNSLAIVDIMTSYPAVSPERCGSGVGSVQRTRFTPDGLTQYTKSPTGRINFFEYDSVCGRVTRSVQDAKTPTPESDVTGDVPDGYGSTGPEGALLRRVRTYAYDQWGRLVRSRAADGKVSMLAYSRLADQRPVVISVPLVNTNLVTGTYTEWSGPATISVLNLDGSINASMTVSDARENWNDKRVVYDSSEPILSLVDHDESGSLLSVLGDKSPTGTPVFSRGMLTENIFSRNGRQLLRERTFTPAIGNPEKHFETTLAYEANGRLASTTTPAGTITSFVYDDATGQVSATRRGTSPANMVTIAEYQYDNNAVAGGGNGLLTRARRFTTAVGNTWNYDDTAYFYDYRDRPVGVQNPAQPHQLIAYDNQSRIRRVGLLGDVAGMTWDTVSVRMQAMDGGVGLTSLRALAEWNYDERGRVYLETRYNVDPFDGSLPQSEPFGLSQATVYGAEGSVRATFGSIAGKLGTWSDTSGTTVKYERNRACEVTVKYTIAQTEQPQTHAQAGSIQSGDIILSETRYAVEQSTGRVVAAATIDRGPTPDTCFASPWGGSLFPTGFISPKSDGFTFTTATPSGGEDPFHGHLTLEMVWYDKLGRPRIEAEWGYRHAAAPNWPFPIHYDREFNQNSPSVPAGLRGSSAGMLSDSDFAPRVRSRYFNPLGLLENETGPDGTGRFSLYDFAGRPIGFGSTSTPFSTSPPFRGYYNPCGNIPVEGMPTPEETLEWDDKDRIRCSSTVVQGHREKICGIPRDLAPLDEPHPQNPFIWVGANGITPPMVADNELPIGISREAYQPISSDPWPSLERQQYFTWYSYDAQGRVTETLEPGSRRTTIVRDHMGRVREQLQIPLDPDPITNLPKPRKTKFDFDELGRPIVYEDFSSFPAQTQPNSRVRVKYDAFGNPLGMFTDIFPEGGGAPILGMAIKQEFKIRDIFGPAVENQPNFPWLTALNVPTDIELPGGLNVKPRYGECGSNEPYAFLTECGLVSEDKFDPSAMLGRITAIDIYRWSQAPHLYPLTGPPSLDDVKPNKPQPSGSNVPPPFREPAMRGGYLGIAHPSWFDMPVWDNPSQNLIQPKDICACTTPWSFDPNGVHPNRWGEPEVDPWEYCSGTSCDPMNPLGGKPWWKDQFDRDDTDGGIKKETVCVGDFNACNPEISIDTGNHGKEPPEPFCSGAGTTTTQYTDPLPKDGTIKRSSLQWLSETTKISEELETGRVSQKLRSFKRTVPQKTSNVQYELAKWGLLDIEAGSNEQVTTFAYAGDTLSPGHSAFPHRLASFTRGDIPYTVAYDSRGNLVDDGVQFMYAYDLAGNLTHVFRRDTVNNNGVLTPQLGSLYARFRYDALGRRISAAYDENPNSLSAPSKFTDDVFEDDFIEYYGYDDRWRLTTVWRQDTVGGLNVLTGKSADGVRPPPALYERILHRYVGRGGSGEGWFLDAPIYSQINTNWQKDVYGDDTDDGDEGNPNPDNDLCPTWEIQRQYLQSQVTGDILGVIDYDQSGFRKTTRFDYSMFGLPRLLPTTGVQGSAYGADLDNDGDITNGLNPDGGVDINDQLAFLALFQAGDARGDLTDGSGMAVPDASADINDLIYFLQMFEQGYSVTPEPVRFGWRGYLWDGKLNVHHVRHRVFDPKLMTWLQPDPLGTIDGPNIYAYAGWDPFNKIDPYGLAADESCTCASGGGGGNSEGSSSNDPFSQMGLDDLDANTRAGRGPRNEGSAELRHVTKIAGNAFLAAATAPLDPDTYINLLYRGLTNPVQLWVDTANGAAQTISDIWNFNDLSPERKAEMYGGGGGGGLWAAAGMITRAGSAASVSSTRAVVRSSAKASLPPSRAKGFSQPSSANWPSVARETLGHWHHDNPAVILGRSGSGPKKDGIIYERIDPRTGERYVGKSQSDRTFAGRRTAHDRLLGVPHTYDELERVDPAQLDMAEEDWIRRRGGPKNKGGNLANKRYQVNDKDYCARGGKVPKPTP
jgi:RHS repeat-associated protein